MPTRRARFAASAIRGSIFEFGLLQLDARCSDHLGPFIGIVDNVLTEFIRRICRCCIAEITDPLPQRGTGEARVDRFVERFDDLVRRIPRNAKAGKSSYLEAGHEFAHCGNVRQQRCTCCRRPAISRSGRKRSWSRPNRSRRRSSGSRSPCVAPLSGGKATRFSPPARIARCTCRFQWRVRRSNHVCDPQSGTANSRRPAEYPSPKVIHKVKRYWVAIVSPISWPTVAMSTRGENYGQRAEPAADVFGQM
jgi:hypothetical protein